jgi:hypothetical protein
VSDDQFIEDPVLLNLVQRVKARRSPEFLVIEQLECLMGRCLSQSRGRGSGRLLGLFELRFIGCHGTPPNWAARP